MGYADGKDWTNVSFETGRRQLREWRETNARRSEEVVELWEHVVSRSPSSLGDELWIVYEQVCVAALDCARLDLAGECISALNHRFPRSNRVLRLQAMHHEAADQFDTALALYERLIEEDPTNNSFRKRKVAVLLAQGMRLEAIRELNDYLKIFLNDSEAWLQLSELFLVESDFAKAAHCLEECVLAAPLNTLQPNLILLICVLCMASSWSVIYSSCWTLHPLYGVAVMLGWLACSKQSLIPDWERCEKAINQLQKPITVQTVCMHF
ncbi:unnamed protein product [Cylicocyclus nassatus]|uniref:ER membrane protein complex subunit 2 n=1 Tax=Cylicocyclus nassatus TaxID=53992 RepID=A0AA36HBR3_CYLNA|nr:unnamed protein product [Cylicocyclus nassatus]